VAMELGLAAYCMSAIAKTSSLTFGRLSFCYQPARGHWSDGGDRDSLTQPGSTGQNSRYTISDLGKKATPATSLLRLGNALVFRPCRLHCLNKPITILHTGFSAVKLWLLHRQVDFFQLHIKTFLISTESQVFG
jgi:hypothetical protein